MGLPEEFSRLFGHPFSARAAAGQQLMYHMIGMILNCLLKHILIPDSVAIQLGAIDPVGKVAFDNILNCMFCVWRAFPPCWKQRIQDILFMTRV